MLRRLFLSVSLALPILVGGLGVSALPVQAQVTEGLDAVGQTVKLSSEDPRVIVARIINIALGLIGIILVSLLLYAGFLWMTAGGNDDQIKKAKGIIQNSIIGLVIILSAWAITTYVINALLGATNDGSGGSGGGGGSQFQGGLGGGGSSALHVTSISPKGDVLIRNVVVKIWFDRPVDDKTISGITVKKTDGTVVDGTLKVEDGSKVLFTPSADCPAPNQDRKCFDANTEFTVTVPSSVKALSGSSLQCTQFSPCTSTFKTGDLVDTQPPVVGISFPLSGMSISVNSIQTVQAFASDDQGVSLVDFLEGSDVFGTDSPQANTAFFDAKADWDTVGASLGEHTLSSKASDIDANTAASAPVTVMVRLEHCFNGKQDGGETGLDCGGDPQSADYCGACQGGSCSKNQDCSTGFCQNNVCVAQPVISSVGPLNGKPGTFVTLKGTNFGASMGEVVFLGNVNDPGDDKVAQAPVECSVSGGTWTNTMAVVAVPEGANSGPLRLKNAASGLTDVTSDTTGPKIEDFQVDNTEHPGLCALKPVTGTVGTEVEAQGAGFGSVAGKVGFGKLELSNVIQWTGSAVRFKVPVSNSGIQSVVIKTASGDSNPVDFIVQDKDLGAAPEIATISPEKGPKQEYVTLFGKNFGFSTGFVLFRDQVKQLEAIGDTNFPAICSNGFWKDTYVIVKVPEAFKDKQLTTEGKYTVTLKRADGAISNGVNFEITSGTPKPGICSLEPGVGPEKTTVTIGGEHLGFEKPTAYFSSSQGQTVQAEVGDSFSNEKVTAIVPKGAVTGPMSLQIQGKSSNAVDFQVLNCNQQPGVCGPADKFQCCPSGVCMEKNKSCGAVSLTAQYAWQTSTGLIPIAPRVIEECRPDLKPAPAPSPSPWLGRAGGNQAPVDSAIQMRFSRHLDPKTVTVTNFQLLKCTGSSEVDPCTQTESVFYPGLDLIPANAEQDLVKLQKTVDLVQNTTYLVNVLANVKASGVDGANMEESVNCGKTKDGQKIGYCFRFKTRDSKEPSKINEVSVIPNPYKMHEELEKANYLSSPVNSDDKCIYVECMNKQWSWYTGTSENNEDSRASISKSPVQSNQSCVQKATALKETGDVPVDVNAKLIQSSPVVGTAKLFVKFLPPKVVSYGPNCDLACTNAKIWANFSSALDLSSVNFPGNIVVHPCKNEQCIEAEFGPPVAIQKIDLVAPSGDTAQRRIEISPKFALTPGAFYRVLLRGGPAVPFGIKGKNQVPMEGLNHPLGFAWKFRVKQEPEAFCVADRVEVVPEEKYETQVGASQIFHATPYGKPDACDATGQALVQTTEASWSVANPKVATLWKGGKVNTGADLPAGCSGKCVLAGAPITVKESAAVCGNGKIETNDKKYCVNGKTPAGDACVLMAAGAKAGEECEPGVGVLGSKCEQTSCLIVVDPASSSCGNGVVEAAKGEECDYGPTCFGGMEPKEGVKAVADGASCLLPAQKDACVAAGGKCDMFEIRGCSSACKHLGATAGKSTCGNNDALGDGKDCDDGNGTDGDGCSSQCLHEGSSSKSVLYAVCGNQALEAGEACEATGVDGQGNPIFPSGCDSKTCLRTGVLACASSKDKNCCGNSNPKEAGKDCDDGNSVSGDGCSAACLFEGSSAYYTDASGKPTPSFCSDGVLAKGEQCEAKALGDSYVDNSQLATIVGSEKPDANGLMQTDVKANVELKDGKAVYGLQCGFTQESSCPSGFGLDDGGCCRPRPSVTTPYPPKNATGVCRNVQVSGVFNAVMNSSSVINNFELSEAANAQGVCPQGTTEVLVMKTYDPGFWGKMQKWWDSLVTWLTGEPVYAAKWCKGGVTGKVEAVGQSTETNTYAFTLDVALKPQTKYRVRFMGDQDLTDNADKLKKLGVKTVDGVVQQYETVDNGSLTWVFTTGDQVCAVNQVSIEDVTQPNDHPFLFVNPGNKPETRAFKATAQSIQSGVPVNLSTVKGYDWAWDHWVSSVEKEGIVKIATDPDVGKVQSMSGATAISGNKTGNGVLVARIKVMNDEINVPSTKDQAIEGVAPVSVMVCTNPWPSDPKTDAITAPFRDAANSPSKLDLANLASLPAGDPFASPMNFSMMYCRDAGVEDSLTDDLPAMNITLVPNSAVDDAKGILRQYLLTYPDLYASLKQDGVGIRIFKNPMHMSPEEWYYAQGFNGSPKSVEIDGYPAIVDGNTTYVAASNRPQIFGSVGKIYSNIFVLSFNPNASKTTQDIAKQLVENLSFNINITGQGNVCLNNSTNSYYTIPTLNNGKPIGCTTDWDCLQFGNPNVSCQSLKWKLIRDTVRIKDFQNVSKALESAKSTVDSTYPQLKTGTFLPGQSNSRWASWQEGFGAAIGAAPVDPINQFIACGRCEKDVGIPCGSNDQCPSGQACKGGRVEGNGQWKFIDSVDPASCWDKEASNFSCPRFGNYETGVSRMYQYRAVNAGQQYELSAEFEVPPTDPANWWDAPLPDANYRCFTNDASRGRLCSGENAQGDASCRACTDPTNCFKCVKSGIECSQKDANACKSIPGDSCAEVPVIPGVCRKTGGNYRYKDICKNVMYGQTGICGDGVVQQGEACELGQTKQTSNSCPNGQAKLQTCVDCKGFQDDPKNPACFSIVQCGNGKVDKVCSFSVSGAPTDQICQQDADCTYLNSKGSCIAKEVCDEGKLNGSYAHCNLTCTGYEKFCGNGKVEPGEVCDLGSQNGKPESACSLDCKGPGPKCGDGEVNGDEQCDGGVMMETSALCVGGVKEGLACTQDADCPGSVCGKGPGAVLAATEKTAAGYQYQSCVGVTVKGADGIERNTQHVRLCNAPGTANQCKLAAQWSACTVVGTCGDGVKDGGEDCDDGNQNNSDSCTNSCKKNVCGDAFVNVGVEECDEGTAKNGKITCNADYGSSCLSCSSSCKLLSSQGGFCGNGTKEGVEQCDGNTVLSSKGTTCPAGTPSFLCDAIYPTRCMNQPCVETKESVSCKSLGYDFSTNPRDPVMVGPTNPPADVKWPPSTSDSSIAGCPAITGMKWYEYQMFKECAGLMCSTTYQSVPGPNGTIGKVPVSQWASSALPGTSGDFWKCVTEKGGKYGISVKADQAAKPSCGLSCSFSGCGKCSDAVGNGSIAGYVYDAVYQQVVPNARVTLMSKGVKVGEVYTDQDGKFGFSVLNTSPECSSYRLVVDMYQDNPCTGSNHPGVNCRYPLSAPWNSKLKIDEGVLGGYFPYTSEQFSFSDFNQKFNATNDEPAHVNIFPRPAFGNAYVSVLWQGGKNPSFFQLHTILPEKYAFSVPVDPGNDGKNYCSFSSDPMAECQATEKSTKCNYSNRPDGYYACSRDVNARAVGYWNTDAYPYVRLICLHHPGDRSYGWNYDPNAGGSINDCPVEGTSICYDQCKQDAKKTDQECRNSCGLGVNSSGESNVFLVDVGGKKKGESNCSATPTWESCFGINGPPITSFVNYKQFAMGNTDPLRFVWQGTGSLTSSLKQNKGSVYFVTSETLIPLSTADLASVAGAHHLADLNPLTGVFTVVNQSKGADMHSSGEACYSYEYQCSSGDPAVQKLNW